MANKVWVYIDHFKGIAVLTSWEAVGAAKALARQMGTGVTAFVLATR